MNLNESEFRAVFPKMKLSVSHPPTLNTSQGLATFIAAPDASVPVGPVQSLNTPYGGVGDVNSKEKGTGARYNGGKPDMSLIPLWTLEDEARVWEYGKKKYAAWNWAKGMDWSIAFSCLMRHMSAWQRGEENDVESGLPHLAHAMCNLRMLTLYAKTYKEGDDRPPVELMKETE